MTEKLSRTKAILISSIGGGLEMYDFTIYVFFAPILAMLFFPPQNNLIPLLNTFVIFAVGYFARPLGAIVFGHYGDRFGRKKGMLVSIAIMAISTVLIGLLPTYAAIGIAAPICLVVLRFFQGIAVGGDLAGAITFVAEYADNGKRGLACSFVFCAVNFGLLLASAIGALLTSLLSHEALIFWGWRLAFILGLLIGIIGLYLRSRVAETPYFSRLEHNHDVLKVPLLHLFRMHSVRILQGIGLVWLFSVIIAQVFLYMPTYLFTVAHLKMDTALIVNSVNILIFSLCIPLAGYLSDKIGRKSIILIAAFLFVIFAYPLYILLNSSNFIVMFAALISFAILSAAIVGTVPSALTEMFPTHVRYSGVAFSYNISCALFAGLTPVFVTYLLYKLEFSQAPFLNLVFGAIVTFITAVSVKERGKKSLI